MSVSTPPRLSASAISRTRSSTAARALERADVERDEPAEAPHLALRQRVLRVRGQARVDACASPSGARPGTRRCAMRVGVVRSMRIGSVLVPRSTSHASIGPRMAPAAFCTKRSHSTSSSCVDDDDAADAVAVAVQELGRAVQHDVGAERERLLHVGAGERVVDDHAHAVAVGDLAGRRDVGDAQHRVGGRLDEQVLRRRRERRRDGVEVATCRRR